MELFPTKGFGQLELGMPILAAQAVLPGRKREASGRIQCLDVGVFLDGDSSDRLEFIEHFLPEMSVTFDGLDLWALRSIRTLVKRGHALTLYERSRSRLDFRDLGLAFYIEDDEIKSVSAFPPGYYDESSRPTLVIGEASRLPSWLP